MFTKLIQSTIIIICTLLLLCCKKKACSNCNIDKEGYWPQDSIRIVKQGLSFPWEITWGKDDFIWMTERGGKISKLNPLDGSIAFTAAIADVVSRGEGGLLGLVQHPDFLNNGYIYIVYNYLKNNNYTEKIVRLTFKNNNLIDPLILLDNIPASNIHNGSRLFITPDNKLLATIGDASVGANAQDLSLVSGKLLRLNLDGSIPTDNPFPNSYIWSYGHRNQQGLVMIDGKVFTSEHGPNVEDEVNIIEKGRNYGWPNVNGPCDGAEINFCTSNNVKPPIFSSGGSTLAYCGLDYYNHVRILKFKNALLLVTLKDESLRCLKLNAEKTAVLSSTTYFKSQFGRLRDVCVSPAGRVYICTSIGNGLDKLIELGAL